MTGAPYGHPGGSVVPTPGAIVQNQKFVPQVDAEPVYLMTAEDRCESCVQRAWARIYMSPESYFDLCRHHYLQHKDAILAVAWDVVDETFRIENQKVDVSA